MNGSAFPPEVERLFWDVDPSTVDLTLHADYVIERVMSRGTWSAMQWLRVRYEREQLAEFLTRRAHRLSPRDLAYWCVVAGVELPIAGGGGRPSWAGS